VLWPPRPSASGRDLYRRLGTLQAAPRRTNARQPGRLVGREVDAGRGDRRRGRHVEAFGEPGDARIRAERLDEALEVITRLWSGDEVTHHGKHYTVDGYALTALPLQRPRIPIWVGGDSPAAMRRAARWDGWIGPDEDLLSGTPEEVAAVRQRLGRAGASMPSFEIAWAGKTEPGHDGALTAYQRAGATWWIEMAIGSREDILARVTSSDRRSSWSRNHLSRAAASAATTACADRRPVAQTPTRVVKRDDARAVFGPTARSVVPSRKGLPVR
jgi:alkanesulfonate monooxygenase SsuD/methylene tetrahydromethanopterin reductase-like flavin-dependent oxidoreductase (luciferase family)